MTTQSDEELDLADDIGAALDELGGAKEDAQTEERPARDYNRDEAGKFAAKQAEEAQEIAEAQAAGAGKAWKPLWLKQDHGVEWDKLPEPFRKMLEQREREAAQGIEKHSTAAKAWEPVNQMIGARAQEFAAAGVTPQQYVGQLIQADNYLRQDPVAAINWIVQQYLGTDVYALADWMHQQGMQAQQVDPRDQRIQQLEQRLTQFETQGQQAQRAAVERQISDWSRDKPYFADVRQHMAALARANPEATLDQLYEQATWAHPDIRQRILEDQRRAEVQRARAGRQSPRQGAPNGELRQQRAARSIEEDVAAALDEAGLT